MDSLRGATIRYNFEGVGWLEGVVYGANDDDAVFDDDEVANFIVYYEADDTEVPHYFDVLDYMPQREAPPGAWHVVCEAE